jgi:hypothetical protein
MIAGTPMEQDYRAKSPRPDKLGTFDQGFTGWADADIEGIAAPTLITVGDCDAVRLDHAARFLQLRGGDVNGDLRASRPRSWPCFREPPTSSGLPGPSWSWTRCSLPSTHRRPKADHARGRGERAERSQSRSMVT